MILFDNAIRNALRERAEEFLKASENYAESTRRLADALTKLTDQLAQLDDKEKVKVLSKDIKRDIKSLTRTTIELSRKFDAFTSELRNQLQH